MWGCEHLLQILVHYLHCERLLKVRRLRPIKTFTLCFYLPTLQRWDLLARVFLRSVQMMRLLSEKAWAKSFEFLSEVPLYESNQRLRADPDSEEIVGNCWLDVAHTARPEFAKKKRDRSLQPRSKRQMTKRVGCHINCGAFLQGKVLPLIRALLHTGLQHIAFGG